MLFVSLVVSLILLLLGISMFLGCFVVKADYKVTKQVKVLHRLTLWFGILIGSVLFLTSALPGQPYVCLVVHLAVPALVLYLFALGLRCGLSIQQDHR
ncbi:MAG: hypothetical protein K2W95_05785 [Candidatus Obscuribacterales bacterium]|nr:hypothetical protein [Candidatus Obscuribacterales bacterium]